MTTLIVGALIGFASAFLLRSWQYRRDLWLKRIEVLCSALDVAAEAGTKYWLGDTGPVSAGASASRILGLQVRIDGMFAALGLAENPKLMALLSDFRDSLTGGNFESATFVADPDRARLTQMFASELITETWIAAYYQLSFSDWRDRRMHEARVCKTWCLAQFAKMRAY